MFKKSVVIFIAFLFLAYTTRGRSPSGSGTETNQKYIVSAIGFDNVDNKINVSLETLIVNSENASEEQNLQILSGSGATVDEALEEIGKSLAKPLLLSHCGILVFGETLTPEQIDEICDYCFRKNEITLSVYVVSSKNGAKLLNCRPISSVAVGYDVIGLIEEQSTRTGVNYKNRYYEVEASRERVESIFTASVIEVEEEKFKINGMSIYVDDQLTAVIDNHQSIIYSMLTGTYSKGYVEIDNNKHRISSAKAKYKFGKTEEPSITVELYLESNTIDEKNFKTLQNRIIELDDILKNNCSVDVFGFENILYHDEETKWEELQNDYLDYYKKSELIVEFSVGSREDGWENE